MKRNVMLQTVLLICILFTLPALSAAEENRRDGNWWQIQNANSHYSYLTGFFDGMELGNNFSYWDFINDKKKMHDCFWNLSKSYTEYTSKYFKNVTNVQLVDGLDTFYADFRNRRILVSNAVWLVVNGIAGTPQKKLDTLIESWRSNTN